ncbi:MAG: hypothetical protein QW594_00330 [Candidatus Woesearchaeota archaeon]
MVGTEKTLHFTELPFYLGTYERRPDSKQRYVLAASLYDTARTRYQLIADTLIQQGILREDHGIWKYDDRVIGVCAQPSVSSSLVFYAAPLSGSEQKPKALQLGTFMDYLLLAITQQQATSPTAEDALNPLPSASPAQDSAMQYSSLKGIDTLLAQFLFSFVPDSQRRFLIPKVAQGSFEVLVDQPYILKGANQTIVFSYR